MIPVRNTRFLFGRASGVACFAAIPRRDRHPARRLVQFDRQGRPQVRLRDFRFARSRFDD